MRLDRLLTLSIIQPLKVLTNDKGLRIPILMYHRISRDDERGIHPYYKVVTTPEVFMQHMALLAESGYRVIGLDTAVELLRRHDTDVKQDLPAKPVVITFDDGFSDFYTEAYPVLASHGFTATVFLPTSFIDNPERTIMGKSFLTWSQVRELSNVSITFGSHSVSHRAMDALPKTEIDNELRHSKETIEDKIGKPVHTFSCPYAFPEHDKDFVTYLHDTLIACDYSGAVTTRIGTATIGDNLFTLKRIPVNADDDPDLLSAKIAGAYNWMHTAQYTVKTARAMLGLRRRKSIAKWTSA